VRSFELEPEGTGHVNEVKRKRQFCEADSSGFGLTVNRVSNRVGGELDKVGLLEEEEEEEEEGTVSLGCKVKIFSTTRPG
jgi:hypothetical protein